MRFVAIWLIPGLALFTIFAFVPIVWVIWLSFHRYNLLAPTAPWIGLDNYNFAIHKDPIFRTAMTNTLKYAAVAVPLNIFITLPLAIGLNNIDRLRSLFRTAFFLPVIASAVAVSLVWLPIYDPSAGWLNGFLESVGLPTSSWLQDPDTALWAVMVTALWQDMGYNLIIFLAGLQGIPEDISDAAEVDGAGSVRRFFSITLPLLRPTIAFVFVLTAISYLQEFSHVQVMTNGGPIHSSETLVVYTYLKAFRDLKMGYASALSIFLLVIMMIVTLISLRLLRARWEY